MLDALTKAPALMRVGAVLAVLGAAGVALAVRYAAGWWLFVYGPDALAVVAGALMMRGHLSTARLVRAVAAFGLGVIAVGLIGLAVIWPLDLIFAEIRLDPISVLPPSLTIVAAVCIQLWIVWDLGRQPIHAANAAAGLRRWNPATAAKAGAAAMFVVVVLLWAMLHGNSASAAVALAQQQLGPDYRYALTWITRASHDGHTAIDGVVTAWNQHEVRTVLLHWEQR
jgi:hypothetical protein